jgi:hypothetical protein
LQHLHQEEARDYDNVYSSKFDFINNDPSMAGAEYDCYRKKTYIFESVLDSMITGADREDYFIMRLAGDDMTAFLKLRDEVELRDVHRINAIKTLAWLMSIEKKPPTKINKK